MDTSNLVECPTCRAVVSSTNLSRHKSWHRDVEKDIKDLERKVRNLE